MTATNKSDQNCFCSVSKQVKIKKLHYGGRQFALDRKLHLKTLNNYCTGSSDRRLKHWFPKGGTLEQNKNAIKTCQVDIISYDDIKLFQQVV